MVIDKKIKILKKINWEIKKIKFYATKYKYVEV